MILARLFDILLQQKPWKLIILVVAFWTMCLLISFIVPFAQFSVKKRNELRTRLINSLNAILLISLGGVYIYSLPDFRAPNTKYMDMGFSFSVGFFMYDMVALTFFGILDKQTIIHHVSCIVVYCLTLAYGIGGGVPMSLLFIGEISNPSTQLRVFLRAYGFRNTKFYEAHEYLYYFTYIFFRCIFILPFVCLSLAISETPILLNIINVLTVIQNLLYGKTMVKMSYRMSG